MTFLLNFFIYIHTNIYIFHLFSLTHSFLQFVLAILHLFTATATITYVHQHHNTHIYTHPHINRRMAHTIMAIRYWLVINTKCNVAHKWAQQWDIHNQSIGARGIRVDKKTYSQTARLICINVDGRAECGKPKLCKLLADLCFLLKQTYSHTRILVQRHKCALKGALQQTATFNAYYMNAYVCVTHSLTHWLTHPHLTTRQLR